MTDKIYTGPYQDTGRMFKFYDVAGQKVGVTKSGNVFGSEYGYLIKIDGIEYGILAEVYFDIKMPPNKRYGSAILISSMKVNEDNSIILEKSLGGHGRGEFASSEIQEIAKIAIELDRQVNDPDTFAKFE